MKPTSEILERIEKCSSEHKDGVFTRLYRYLLREDIYFVKIFTTPPIRNFMQTKVQQHRVSTTIPQTVSVTSM